jgi:hypothetical protein
MSREELQPSDQEKLTRALNTIVEVLVGRELTSVRGSVTELDSKLGQRMESMKKDSTAAVDRITKELSSRIDGLAGKLDEAEQRQKTALAESDERTRKSIAALKQQLQEFQSRTDSRIEGGKTEVAKKLEASENKLRKDLDALTAGLSGVQLELHQQTEKTERISILLNSVATVFSGPANAPAVPTEENIESAFDRMFDGDRPAQAAAQANTKAQTRPEMPAPASSTKTDSKKS